MCGCFIVAHRRLTDALAAYETALAHDGDNPAVWANTGRLLVTMGDVDAGVELLTAAVAADPTNLHSYGALGVCWVTGFTACGHRRYLIDLNVCFFTTHAKSA